MINVSIRRSFLTLYSCFDGSKCVRTSAKSGVYCALPVSLPSPTHPPCSCPLPKPCTQAPCPLQPRCTCGRKSPVQNVVVKLPGVAGVPRSATKGKYVDVRAPLEVDLLRKGASATVTLADKVGVLSAKHHVNVTRAHSLGSRFVRGIPTCTSEDDGSCCGAKACPLRHAVCCEGATHCCPMGR